MYEIENKNKQFKLSEVIILICITAVIGFIMGLSLFNVLDKKNKPKEYDEELSKLIDNYNYILNNYYGELDKKTLISGAIEGMLGKINDPYTTFIDENNSNIFNTTLEGKFEGIGVEIVNDSDNNIIVYRVIEDSPASRAGIQSLDIIKAVDGTSLENMSTADFVAMIKNSELSTFNITLLRGNEEISVQVTRELVTIKSVESEIFNRNNKNVGYIHMSIFANNTYNQFKEKLADLEKKGIDSLIIDVRGNTGGHLTSVENILGLFLDKTHVIYQTEDKEEIVKYYSKGNETKTYKIVVLTNEGSASASEILAAALKEEYGATIVGKKTYGKGTVQELKTLPDGEQYKFTTKKWLTPKGNWINEVGIEADIEVEFNKDYYDNPTYENDKQLQRAIEVIIE
ncbi:MAG: S41 family peptidase [Bacilli bacterium]|nr:S41 family peptidase [Bacilli bacterium]